VTDRDLKAFRSAREREGGRLAFGRLLERLEKEHFRKVDAEIARLRTPADVRRWQRRVRARLGEILGEFPERTPLRPRVVGRVRRPDVVVEKVIFESRPRYYVTADLYLPTGRPLPAPGILVPCGHVAEGKTGRTYRDAALCLARRGYVSMVYDPTGQGERSECYDRRRRRHLVHREVPQHHWTGKPAFLTGTTLAGYRTWDGLRALDYLCSRPEVNTDRIGVMGNSGGGAMTLLITACDPRVRACAAGHPGGSMENTHLRGRRPPDRLLYSLIAPRPCRIIVGRASGEEPRHRVKLGIMKPFYRKLGCPRRLDLVVVDGRHDLKRPKREAAYEWLGRWLGDDHVDRGAGEKPFRTISARRLLCTKSGQVQGSPGGETMCSLNRARAARLAPRRRAPRDRAEAVRQRDQLAKKLAARISWRASDSPLRDRTVRRLRAGDLSVELLVFESEPGMPVPALLVSPRDASRAAAGRVVIHAAESGKPTSLRTGSLPLLLARRGHTVLSLDVRDTGEASCGPAGDDDNWPEGSTDFRAFNGRRWAHDILAVRALGVGRSRPAMRALDVVRAIDLLERRRLRTPVLVGEGRGAVWCLKAAALDRRPAAVFAVRMLGSYRMITDNPYYNQFEHFWVPGALVDYDLPDLAALAAPRPVTVLDAVDQMSRRLAAKSAARLFARARGVYRAMGHPNELVVRRTAGSLRAVAAAVAAGLEE
jgi:cephalosporin-C deacetylase-like acetyl esterase